MRRIWLTMAALALFAAVAVAGCGGGSSGSGANSSPASAGGYSPAAAKPVAAVTKGASVKVADTPKLGKVIVDARGMTLYDFHKDKGTTSACYGPCAKAWPPLLTHGAPRAAGGAKASLLGITKRKDGTEQVTYAGHPVYSFAGDSRPGDTNGNDIDDFGGEWYALMANGQEPEDS